MCGVYSGDKTIVIFKESEQVDISICLCTCWKICKVPTSRTVTKPVRAPSMLTVRVWDDSRVPSDIPYNKGTL